MYGKLLFQVLENGGEINETIIERWSKWNVKDGYSERAKVPDYDNPEETEKNLQNEPLPRRAIAAGLMAGLTIVLNVEKEEYYCSGSESVGFKVKVHFCS